MIKNLVIVFVKNIKLGKVKTRLAKTIGNQAASEVYNELVHVTEKATTNLNTDIRIYFSDAVDVDYPADEVGGTYAAWHRTRGSPAVLAPRNGSRPADSKVKR